MMPETYAEVPAGIKRLQATVALDEYFVTCASELVEARSAGKDQEANSLYAQSYMLLRMRYDHEPSIGELDQAIFEAGVFSADPVAVMKHAYEKHSPFMYYV